MGAQSLSNAKVGRTSDTGIFIAVTTKQFTLRWKGKTRAHGKLWYLFRSTTGTSNLPPAGQMSHALTMSTPNLAKWEKVTICHVTTRVWHLCSTGSECPLRLLWTSGTIYSMTHALVTSRMDYCNMLNMRLPLKTIWVPFKVLFLIFKTLYDLESDYLRDHLFSITSTAT